MIIVLTSGGATYLEHRRLKLQRLGSDATLVTVRWIARRPDQSLLWDFLDSYLLALEDGQWRILG